jgi:hypothetical protein
MKSGAPSISLIGALHGELAPLVPLGAPAPFDGMDEILKQQGIPAGMVTLARLGTDHLQYVPWMQATYIMAAAKQALQYLPAGAKLDSLTYDQLRTPRRCGPSSSRSGSTSQSKLDQLQFHARTAARRRRDDRVGPCRAAARCVSQTPGLFRRLPRAHRTKSAQFHAGSGRLGYTEIRARSGRCETGDPIPAETDHTDYHAARQQLLPGSICTHSRRARSGPEGGDGGGAGAAERAGGASRVAARRARLAQRRVRPHLHRYVPAHRKEQQ